MNVSAMIRTLASCFVFAATLTGCNGEIRGDEGAPSAPPASGTPTTRCTPGSTVPAGDDCNTCACDEDGEHVICTDMACIAPSPSVPSEPGAPGSPSEPAPPGASDPGAPDAPNDPAPPASPPDGAGSCTWGGSQYAEGRTFPAGDGCNSCTCAAGGLVICTRMGCIP